LTDDPEKPWENGALSFCMPGHSNKCERYKIECARNNGRSPGGCLGANPATNFVSELKKLDELMVARMAIGVGGGSETTNGSALWMIDNSPDKSTIDPAQVFDNDDLVTAVTSVNVCAEVPVADPTASPTNKPTHAPTNAPTRAPTKAPTPSPTNKPTPGPTNKPTPSPTNRPTPGPTNKPTVAPVTFGGPSLTELGKEGSTGGVVGPQTPPPSCDSDVVMLRKIGGTNYVENPITIFSQGPTEVTFELNQEWTSQKLDYLFVRYKDTAFGFPTCLTFENVSASWTSESLTAFCTKNSKISVVEVWAADSTFKSGLDIAELPNCGCGAPADLPPMVKYQFLVECVSTCPSTDCPVVVVDPVPPVAEECTVDHSLNAVCDRFAVHAHDAITFASGEETRIVGDIGVSPGTSITGQYSIMPGGQVVGNSDAFATSMWGSNGSYAAAIAIRADEDHMGPEDAIEIGGKTFTPGTYRATTALNFAYGTTITLDGENNPNAEFLFQAGTTLTTGADTYFHMINGAKAKNVIWALGTAATLGANSVVEGSILAKTAITFGTMSELRGCAIAKTAVTYESRGYVNVKQQTDASASSCPTVAGASTCENFAVHARTTVTFAGEANSMITNGDVGVSPGTSITGHYHIDGGDTISGGSTESDYAIFAMFNHAEKRSRRGDETYWGIPVKEIGGNTYLPGTYFAGSSINLAHGTTVTLDGGGDPNAEFLFQAGTTMTTAADTYFRLVNGAQAQNIIWALGTSATLGARSVVEGSILAGAAITFGTNSKVHGCAIAQTAVTFETEGYVDLP
jgi:hypothetical protein